MEESIVPGRSTGDIRTINHGGSKSQFPYEIQTTSLKQRDFKKCKRQRISTVPSFGRIAPISIARIMGLLFGGVIFLVFIFSIYY